MSRPGFSHLAVALNVWPTHDAAVDVALAVAAPGGTLTFMQAPAAGGELTAEQQRLFTAAVNRAATRGLRATTLVWRGTGEADLREYIATAPFDALVTGTHRSGAAFTRRLGLATDAFLNASAVPVFLTGENGRSRVAHAIRTLLVPIDGRFAPDAMVETALALAAQSGARLVFGSVEGDVSAGARSSECLARARRLAAEAAVPTEAIVLFGFSYAAVSAAAQICEADMIVCGNERRPAAAGGGEGEGVVDTLIRLSPLPLCIVRSSRASRRVA